MYYTTSISIFLVPVASSQREEENANESEAASVIKCVVLHYTRARSFVMLQFIKSVLYPKMAISLSRAFQVSLEDSISATYPVPFLPMIRTRDEKNYIPYTSDFS